MISITTCRRASGWFVCRPQPHEAINWKSINAMLASTISGRLMPRNNNGLWKMVKNPLTLLLKMTSNLTLVNQMQMEIRVFQNVRRAANIQLAEWTKCRPAPFPDTSCHNSLFHSPQEKQFAKIFSWDANGFMQNDWSPA